MWPRQGHERGLAHELDTEQNLLREFTPIDLMTGRHTQSQHTDRR